LLTITGFGASLKTITSRRSNVPNFRKAFDGGEELLEIGSSIRFRKMRTLFHLPGAEVKGVALLGVKCL
jgi:hypothetical protein